MAESAMNEEEEVWLFSDLSVCALCALWLVAWLLLLRLLPSGVSGCSSCKTEGSPDFQGVSVSSSSKTSPGDVPGKCTSSPASEGGCPTREQLDFYLRKLRRMLIYCIIASVAGVLLFVSCFFAEAPLREMLVQFGPIHQVLFSMAVAHWVVNMWEDWQTRMFVAQGLESESGGGAALFPLNLCCGPREIMLCMYFTHHTISALAYGLSLATHQLGGVMVQGLLFELPVMLMLRKEMAAACEEAPAWLLDLEQVRAHWMLQYLTFALGRGPATALWLISIIPGHGRDKFASIDLGTGITTAYHLMAVFFICLNLRILGLYMVWQTQDMERACKRSEPQAVPSTGLNVVRPTAEQQGSEDVDLS